jgi:hypothetical protein
MAGAVPRGRCAAQCTCPTIISPKNVSCTAFNMSRHQKHGVEIDTPWLVEACAIRAARNEIGPLTKVWLFTADQITTSAATILNAAQLARLVRPNLKREAGGGMAVVVGCDKVEVRASRDDRAVDLVFAVFHGSSGSALWNIVFSRRT